MWLPLLTTLFVAQVPPDAGEVEAVDAGVVEVPDAGAVDDERKHLTVVTGSRTERKAEDAIVATEVITRAQIEQVGARDLPQLMMQQPGVELVYTNRGTGLRLQGMDPQYVLILVDGERVSGRSGAFTDITRFSLRDVERVEIVKGPGAALYGADAIGGVINMITRRPQKVLEGAVRGVFGGVAAPVPSPAGGGAPAPLLEGEVRGYVGSKLGAFELRGGGGYRTRDGYDWDPRDVATNVAALKRYDGDFEVAYAPSAKSYTFARAAYVRTDLQAVDTNGFIDANGNSTNGALFDRYQRTEQFDVWVGTRYAFETDTTLTLRGHFGLFRDQFMLDQRLAHGSGSLDEYSQNLTRLYEAFGQVDQKVGRHQLTAGVEGLREQLLSDRITPNEALRGRIGVWVQDEWTLIDHGPRLALSPGFRVDADTQFGAAPSPRLAVKFDPSPALTLRASWGLGFRPPAFSELYLRFSNAGIGYIVIGNPNLKPEHSGAVNVGFDFRPNLEGWVISGSAWHTSLTDLINVSGSGLPNPDAPSTFSYENVANAYTQGVELSAHMKLSKGTYLDVGYTGMDARDVTRNRALEGRSPHTFNASISSKYRPIGLEGVLRATYRSPRPYYGSSAGAVNVIGDGSTATIMSPGYVDLDLQLTYTRYFFKVFFNASNLLNSGDANYNPRPPRTLVAGLQVEL